MAALSDPLAQQISVQAKLDAYEASSESCTVAESERDQWKASAEQLQAELDAYKASSESCTVAESERDQWKGMQAVTIDSANNVVAAGTQHARCSSCQGKIEPNGQASDAAGMQRLYELLLVASDEYATADARCLNRHAANHSFALQFLGG